MCKVDAELVRRNRLRHEVELRFEEFERDSIEFKNEMKRNEDRLRQLS